MRNEVGLIVSEQSDFLKFFYIVYAMINTKITSEKGIQEGTYIKLGGISQYINIRGENTGNPVILILHGGPGGSGKRHRDPARPMPADQPIAEQTLLKDHPAYAVIPPEK